MNKIFQICFSTKCKHLVFQAVTEQFEPPFTFASFTLIYWFYSFITWYKCFYTGHYIPQLADVLLDHNAHSTGFKFNIKGVAVRKLALHYLPMFFDKKQKNEKTMKPNICVLRFSS